MLFSALIGIANYAIYMATIDYMVAAYGPYSASATGGNGFARDFLAGIAAFYATPSTFWLLTSAFDIENRTLITLLIVSVYTNIPRKPLEYASTILGCIGVLVVIPIYVFYWKGPEIRMRSKFAMTLESDRKRMHAKLGHGTLGVAAEADKIEEKEKARGSEERVENVEAVGRRV